MLENYENNGTDKIGLIVTPTPNRVCIIGLESKSLNCLISWSLTFVTVIVQFSNKFQQYFW